MCTAEGWLSMANFTTLDKGWGSGTPKLKLLPNFGISIGAYPLHDYLQNFQHFGECHDWLTGKISDPVKCQRGFTIVGVLHQGCIFPNFFAPVVAKYVLEVQERYAPLIAGTLCAVRGSQSFSHFATFSFSFSFFPFLLDSSVFFSFPPLDILPEYFHSISRPYVVGGD